MLSIGKKRLIKIVFTCLIFIVLPFCAGIIGYMIWKFVFSLILHFVTALLLIYCCDPWSAECGVSLHKPSVLDLNEFNRQNASEYVEEVVGPAYQYFLLKKELSEFEKNDGGCGGWIVGIVTQCATFHYAFLRLLRLNCNVPEEFQFFGLLFFCCLVCFILYKVLKPRFSIPPFPYTESDLKERFANNYYKISDQNAFNNFVIAKHYNYLWSVREKVIRKKYIFDFFSLIALIGIIIDASNKY